MVVGLDLGVMVGHEDLIRPHHGAIMAPAGSLICEIARPTTLLELRSPWAMASMASAAPRLREWTVTTSPRRIFQSREPMVACWGEMATSMGPLSTRST